MDQEVQTYCVVEEMVYIALGSNMSNPVQQLRQAVEEIASVKGWQVDSCSRLYLSAPVGLKDQPDYYNAVLSICTRYDPFSILKTLQFLEYQHGRERKVRWGQRVLDLDIILYGNHNIDLPQLKVPHCQMHKRGFVLAPLVDIAPNVLVPGFLDVASMLKEVGWHGLQVVGDKYPW